MTVASLIRQVLADTELTDPADVAAEAFARMDPDQYGELLRSVLREAARLEMSRERMTHNPATPAKSSYVAAMQRYAKVLRSRVQVEGVWKFYGDCTHAELVTLANESRAEAARNVAAAERHEKTAAAIQEYGVTTVRELPESVITDLGSTQ